MQKIDFLVDRGSVAPLRVNSLASNGRLRTRTSSGIRCAFCRLMAFKEANNVHCMVPKRYPADMKLGTWGFTLGAFNKYRKLIQSRKQSSAHGRRRSLL
jgi:hypothetical protein